MTDESKHDDLDRSISSVIARGEFASTGDEELDALARLASGLKGLPDAEFKTRLRRELLPPRSRAVGWSFAALNQSAWFSRLGAMFWSRRQRPFLAVGSSCGLAAGACCISGFAANVLGFASAAAVQTYIESSLPYFIALSLAGMLGWLYWLLREQGLNVGTLTRTVKRHGMALGSSYAAVFGASMALTMATGLY